MTTPKHTRKLVPSLRTPEDSENSVFTPRNAKLAGVTPSGRCSPGENGAIGSSGETWEVARVRVLSSLVAAA